MNMKATALTATTVAIASLLLLWEKQMYKSNAEQLSNVKTGYVKVDQAFT